MNYNEYFGKGNQNAGWGTSGTPATENENWDNYFDGQSVHVPIQKIYADSPQVTTPTVPNKGNSYMDVTPVVTERPSHELMLKELQQREAAHRLAQQQKDYYKTWNQKIRQMEEESEGIADGGIVAQAAPGSTETGRLSDYFDMEPGDFIPENSAGRPLNRSGHKAKKVVFTEDGPVYADELSQKSTKNTTDNATPLSAGPQDVVVGDPIPLKDLHVTAPEPEPTVEEQGFVLPDGLFDEDPEPEELETYNITFKNGEDIVKTVSGAPGTAVLTPIVTREGYTFLGWSINGKTVTMPVNQIGDSDVTYIALWEEIQIEEPECEAPDYSDIEEEITEPECELPEELEAIEEIDEPVMEIVTGETEVDGIEEEDIEELEESDVESVDESDDRELNEDASDEGEEVPEESVDDMLGGIDISDLPEDIPMNIDEEYARAHEQKKVAPKKKSTASTARKKSDKTVKTKKKTASKKSTTKKK